MSEVIDQFDMTQVEQSGNQFDMGIFQNNSGDNSGEKSPASDAELIEIKYEITKNEWEMWNIHQLIVISYFCSSGQS